MLRLRPPRTGGFVDGDGGVAVREYGSYDDYIRHQGSKLELRDKAAGDLVFQDVLRERLRGLPLEYTGRSALCLAARLGGEVRALHELGVFAVGLDLNPGRDSPHVLVGDFHAVQFPDGCVDFVYCNSIDHALDVKRLTGEIARVLKPGGTAILEATEGFEDERTSYFGQFESTTWRRLDDLIEVIGESGLRCVDRVPFDKPWPGHTLLFRK